MFASDLANKKNNWQVYFTPPQKKGVLLKDFDYPNFIVFYQFH